MKKRKQQQRKGIEKEDGREIRGNECEERGERDSNAFRLEFPLEGRPVVDPGRWQRRTGEQRGEVLSLRGGWRNRFAPAVVQGGRRWVLDVCAGDDVSRTSGAVEDDRADLPVGFAGGRGRGWGGSGRDEDGWTHWTVEDVYPFLDLLGVRRSGRLSGRRSDPRRRRRRRQDGGRGERDHLRLSGDRGRVSASGEDGGGSVHGANGS